TRQAGLFFEPVQLHLQLPNLLIQLRLQRFLAGVRMRSPIRKQRRCSLNSLPLPVRHLAGMHPVMGSDFLNGLLFLDRLQCDSCLHLRAEAPPLPRFHSCSVSEAAILHLIDWSEFWGAPHSRRCSPSNGRHFSFIVAVLVAKRSREEITIVWAGVNKNL